MDMSFTSSPEFGVRVLTSVISDYFESKVPVHIVVKLVYVV